MKQSSGFLGTAIKVLIVVVLVGLLGGTGWYVWGYYTASSQNITFHTEKAVKGNLTVTISSTGTIEPEEVIDIGAQIAGQVLKFGPDPSDKSGVKTVDWCTNVKDGDLLCELDPSLYVAKVNEAEASLKSAQADLVSKKATLAQAEREWKRAVELLPKGGISLTDYDTARANNDTGSAAVGVSEANIGLMKATLAEANVNLGYTKIKSPVQGIIIDRRVNVGQTVVAGLSAPSLFLLAKDLKRVQVWVSVNEADVGTIQYALANPKGVDAEFTSDAFPGETFKGKVTKVRLNAMMTQNVVTYTVEVVTDNPVTKEFPNGKLLPYLTANVKFIIEKKDNVNLVPNSALRWRPPAGGIAHVHPDFRQAFADSLRRKAAAGDSKANSGGGNGDADSKNPNHATVWVEKDGFARPVKVITGKTDNINTEIVGLASSEKDPSILDFDAGSPLIIGEAQGGPTNTVNPFAPKMFGGKK